MKRRSFLQAAGLTVGAVGLTGCQSTPEGGQSPGSGTLTWWDQFLPTQEVAKELFAEFSEQPGGLPVEYTVYDPTKMGQAIQLAKQSKQMPDIFTLAGVGEPAYKLWQQDWFTPMDLDEAVVAEFPEGTLLTGITVFDDQTYGLPLASFRKNDSLNWFNRTMFEKAGLDPENPPQTYDEFRDAARRIQDSNPGAAGWIAPLQFVQRVAAEIHQLAEAGGSPSSGGVDLKTGEFVVDSEHYLNAIELWQSLQRDGLLFQGSTSLNARTARARWAAGSAGMFLDGQYCIGVVVQEFAEFAESMGVGPVPVPDAGTQRAMNHSPRSPGNTLFISAETEHAEAAGQLLSFIASKEAQQKYVGGMNFPPLYPDVVADSDAHPLFKKALEYFEEGDFLAPDPIVRNPEVSQVVSETRAVDPSLGVIVAGVLSGDVPDAKQALTKLKDGLAAERERAVKVVADKGVDVSEDDWKFDNWERGVDYGQESYG